MSDAELAKVLAETLELVVPRLSHDLKRSICSRCHAEWEAHDPDLCEVAAALAAYHKEHP